MNAAHILVIDAYPGVCEMIRTALEQSDAFHVTCAADADEARSVAGRAPHPDLAIVDASLPGETGIEVAAHLGELAVPILMMTGDAMIADRLDAIGSWVLRKPFLIKELVKRVCSTISEAREHHQRAALLMRKLASSQSALHETLSRRQSQDGNERPES
jgi:DNA-binding response OmpR family regulator